MTKARDIASAAPAPAGVTSTELGYIDGVTSAIQTQMDAKLATSTAASTYVPNSLADAKGDLIVGTADNTISKVTAGANGQSLVADSTTATGLRWQNSQAAGKNLLINGGFDIWQRGVSFSPGNIINSYGGDRWKCTYDDSSSGLTMSRVDIGDLNLGFKYAVSLKNTVGTKANASVRLQQAFETHDTHMMRGKTYTLSFYARKINGSSARITHMAGWTTGETNGFGSLDETQVTIANGTLTSSFQRFSQTFVASTNTSYNSLKIQIDFQLLTSLNDELQVTGVQLEEGSVPTTFARAGGTLQGELAACQRYYYRQTANGTNFIMDFGLGTAASTTSVEFSVPLPVQMRVVNTALDSSSLQATYLNTNHAITSPVSGGARSGVNIAHVTGTVSGATQYRSYFLGSSSGSGYIGFSAEL